MIQRFIELGEGYSDLYELLEIAHSNKHRLAQMIVLHTTIRNEKRASVLVVLHPAAQGNFQPLYVCLEGIPAQSKRLQLFLDAAQELHQQVITFDVQPADTFGEKELYFQYLTGILRLNYLIPPLL
ncbi:hypothetical protein A374_12745 [Fictibacillus macauensis ZFHKF-1]|uniref:DUF7147 domain-containing protein n=1 Tax=Fictibacillus macauensis ZFHKF-1 TaxID=1196324 RepID=I8AHJ1_9BACL|nr:hypothetical protein [Fictibacillus macauensis]EIT84914.1 hypothetical protein A374_12745 [Fictibacillus macauensis ZFHKF-1]